MKLPADPRDLAVDLLPRSICSVQVAAVLTDKHGIYSWGWNNVGTCYGMHAEIHCLLRANRKRLPGSTLYVASQRQRNLKPVTSKPCLECAAAIRWAKIGKVLWRAGDERWIEETYA